MCLQIIWPLCAWLSSVRRKRTWTMFGHYLEPCMIVSIELRNKGAEINLETDSIRPWRIISLGTGKRNMPMMLFSLVDPNGFILSILLTRYPSISVKNEWWKKLFNLFFCKIFRLNFLKLRPEIFQRKIFLFFHMLFNWLGEKFELDVKGNKLIFS